VDSAADNAAVGRAALAKATARLIPFLFLLYIVALLDRVNVGFAALQMNEDLGFSDAVYGLGAGIFFIGYFIFEIPSNLILERIGARVWIARIMIISAAMFFVAGPVSFYAGLLLLAALILIAGLLVLVVRHERSLEEVEEVVAPTAGTLTSG
jgi:ACS family tartrate transporter-like MFS transporter